MNPKLSLPILALFLVALPCCCGGTTPQPTSAPGDTSIGTIRRVRDTVQRNNAQVTGTDSLYQNDSLNLFNGGEGLLDFGGDLLLRLFNTTKLGGITVASAPGTPLDVRIYLELGGFTGRKTQPGGKASFETPGGARINVYGTTFYIVYDPASQVTTAGNFDGSMDIDSAGSGPVPIPPGTFRQAAAGQPPSPEAPIPYSPEEFEGRARELGSPVAALGHVVEIITPEVLIITPEVLIITPELLPVDLPPTIEQVTVDPPEIGIGSECPAPTGMTQVTVSALDDNGVVARAVARWSQGLETPMETPLDRVDDLTFSAAIGPVNSPGELIITIIAWDSIGQVIESAPIIVKVFNCIG